MVQDGYRGQNPFGSTRPVRYHTGDTKGWWRYYCLVLMGIYAFACFFIFIRVGEFKRYWVGFVSSVRWRRLKRLIGLKRSTKI